MRSLPQSCRCKQLQAVPLAASGNRAGRPSSPWQGKPDIQLEQLEQCSKVVQLVALLQDRLWLVGDSLGVQLGLEEA